MTDPSLETGTVFDAALSGNYCAICDSVSVMAVREKCDEKGLRADTAVSGVGSWEGAPSRKAREGAHPQLFSVYQKTNPRYIPSLNWPNSLERYILSCRTATIRKRSIGLMARLEPYLATG